METDILFIQPSMSRGAARSWDLFGSLDDYNFSVSPEEADRLAFAADFQAIREDYKKAMEAFIKEMEELEDK